MTGAIVDAGPARRDRFGSHDDCMDSRKPHPHDDEESHGSTSSCSSGGSRNKKRSSALLRKYRHRITNRRVRFVARVDSTLLCVLCSRPALETVVALVCGCRFCTACYRRLFRDGVDEVSCPGKTADCQTLSRTDRSRGLVSDIGSRRQLDRQQVHCLKANCPAVLPLRDLASHLDECDFSDTDDAEEVDEDDDLTPEVARQILSESPDLSVTRQLALLLRIHIPTDLHPSIETIEDPPEKVEQTPTHAKKMTLMSEKLVSSVDQLLVNRLRPEEVQRHNDLLTRCANIVAEMERHDVSRTVAPRQVGHVNQDGLVVVKIDQFRQLRRQVIDQEIADGITSPVFMKSTGRGRYKMCVRVYMNGCGSGLGTHLSVFLVLLKGEHDALLAWPFSLPFTITLVAQNGDRSDICSTVQPNRQTAPFQRPQAEMNPGGGNPRLVPLAMLEQSNVYLRDDTIFVKVKVG